MIFQTIKQNKVTFICIYGNKELYLYYGGSFIYTTSEGRNVNRRLEVGLIGLNKTEVDRLIKEFSIYLPDDGRINLGGLNKHNIEYVIESISSILIS